MVSRSAAVRPDRGRQYRDLSSRIRSQRRGALRATATHLPRGAVYNLVRRQSVLRSSAGWQHRDVPDGPGRQWSRALRSATQLRAGLGGRMVFERSIRMRTRAHSIGNAFL